MKDIRHEPIKDIDIFRIDGQGVSRNRYLTHFLKSFSLNILDHGHFVGDLTWNQYGVISPFTRIYCIISGSGWLDTDEGQIPLTPGNMYMIPTDTKVDLRTNKKLEKYYFHVTWHYVDIDILNRIGKVFSLPFSEDDLNSLDGAYKSNSPSDFLLIKGLITIFLSRFINKYMPGELINLEMINKYADIYAYIETNLSAKLTALKTSEDLNYTYETLRKRFREDNNITLHRYISNRLIQKAGINLLSSDKTIQEISQELGYDDPFYFSRIFKQKMNYSPREYRRINAIIK